MNFEEIWWILKKFDEFWRNLMNFEEIWWILKKFDEIQQIMDEV